METVEGLIESIIYANEQNGYTVCELRSGRKLITVVGYMPEINEGETLKVNGVWVNHQDYGQQLKAEYFERVLPTEISAIERYLASGVIKGIGAKTAKRIVELFGKETFSILEFEPERLETIKGMTHKKAMAVSEIFKAQQGMRTVTMFFQKYGISALYASKIYKLYGANSIDEIKGNPYKLTDEKIGIGFKTADKMAVAVGIDRVSKFRIQSGVKYVLSRAAMDGNTYLPQTLLLNLSSELLGVRLEEIEDVLVLLALEDSIYVEKNTDNEARIYLSAFQQAELGICNRLKMMSLCTLELEDIKLNAKIKTIEETEGIQLAKKQKEAIIKALKSRVMVITGGPGTGKTTIIKCILSLLQEEGLKTLLAAPTGRAAKRMSEATGFEAKTLHRLLEMAYSPDSDKPVFNRGEDNPIDADIIIVDEMSMVDTLLMYYLLKAIETGTRLILVGDMDQLPSVGAGRVLADIIESQQIDTVKLDEIFRQAQESMIVVNAHRINAGEYPKINIKGKDFFFMKKNSGEDIVSAIVDLCDRRLPQSYGYNSIKDIQVLTPTKKGSIGVINLNNALQQVLNPSQKGKAEKTVRDFVLREGDRVMQIKNNYSLKWIDINNSNIKGEGVFNGDMGIISKIDEDMKVVTVEFDDDRVADYDYDLLDELQLSYAITIHKSQGSEFPVVIIPMYSMPPMLMNRNLLYTAVTRAKTLVILVGWDSIMCKMVDNKKENERYSALKDKLSFNGKDVVI